MSFHEHNNIGYWGRVTSTLDWCEGNYEVSPYVAEFWNTVSNIFMILPPLIGVWHIRNIELRFVGCYVSLICVGLGSWLFHMTLRYSMQLADELPMIWGTAVLIYALVELDQPPRLNLRLTLALLAYCSAVTAAYLILRQPLVHQVAYGTMVVASILSCGRVVVQQRHYANTPLFLLSCGAYAAGFLLWNVDTIFCPKLRQLRTQVLAPGLRPVLQLHAWWHVLAGVSTYIGLMVAIDMRLRILKRRSKFCWCGPLPFVHKVVENGSV